MRVTWALLLVLCTALAPGTAPALADEYLRIGSWNIQNLGDRGWGQHPEALADLILLAGVDLLVLQEIHTTDGSGATRRNDRLDDALAIVDRHSGQSWQYELYPKRHQHETERLIGVAWNSQRVTKEESYRIPVSYASSATWNRTPYAVRFTTRSGKTDFVVVPLHMKSNRGGAEAARGTRAQEAQALVAKLPQVRQHFGGENDILLIGDTNCLNGAEPAIGLYEDAGFRDLNKTDVVTYRSSSYASPFDRILIPLGESEFRYSRQYVLVPGDPSSHHARLSDHFVVLMTMRVMDDDD